MNVRGFAMFGALAAAGIAVYVILVRASSAASSGGAGLDAINPASPDNVINRAVNGIVASATGGADTLGTWIAGLGDNAGRIATAPSLPRVGITGADFMQMSDETMARDDLDAGWFISADQNSVAPFLGYRTGRRAAQ